MNIKLIFGFTDSKICNHLLLPAMPIQNIWKIENHMILWHGLYDHKSMDQPSNKYSKN